MQLSRNGASESGWWMVCAADASAGLRHHHGTPRRRALPRRVEVGERYRVLTFQRSMPSTRGDYRTSIEILADRFRYQGRPIATRGRSVEIRTQFIVESDRDAHSHADDHTNDTATNTITNTIGVSPDVSGGGVNIIRSHSNRADASWSDARRAACKGLRCVVAPPAVDEPSSRLARPTLSAWPAAECSHVADTSLRGAAGRWWA